MTGTTMSRKQFLGTAAGIAAAAATGSVICRFASAAEKTGAFVPGIYEGVADGFQGIVRVHVTVTDDEIVNIDVVENTEQHTTVPSEAAIAAFPQRIVAAQSLDVDTVAGATFTSMGIANAVEAALVAAGADEADLHREVPAADVAAMADEDVDFLVIGAGAAGLSAALSAITNDLAYEASGYKVMLVEHNAYIGGTSMMSEGGVAFCSGTSANERLGVSLTGEGLADLAEDLSGEPLNRPAIAAVAENGGPVINKLVELGCPLPLGKAMIKNLLPDDPTKGTLEIESGSYTDPDNYEMAGVRITRNLGELCGALGVDIRLETTATELLMEDGAVAGARMRTAEGAEYDVHAKKTILATGGYARNPQMVAEYSPNYVGTDPFCSPYSVGSGHQMAIDAVGARVVGNGLIAYPGANARWGMGGLKSGYLATGDYVNQNGERFYDERDIDKRCLGRNICAQPGATIYSIFDGDAVCAELVPAAKEQGYAFEAETLEELAEQIGVPFEPMMASIESCRAAIEAGVDEEYHVPVELLNAVAEPPYYAIAIRSIAIGSIAGVEVDENCQVLDAQGQPAPNLYAAGEVMLGNIMSGYYVLGSYSLGTCLPAGHIAVEHAKATL